MTGAKPSGKMSPESFTIKDEKRKKELVITGADDPASFARVEKMSAGLIALLARHHHLHKANKEAAAAKVSYPTQEEFTNRLQALFIKYKCEWVAENRYGWKSYIDILRSKNPPK